MLRLVYKRIWGAITLVVIASVFCFMLVATFKGSVAVVMAEQRSGSATRENIEKIEQELGLGDPILVRYGRWLNSTLHGDLGESLRTGDDVGTTLVKRTKPTAVLILGGAIVALLIGTTFSFLGALRPGGIMDRIFRGLALVGASLPKFFIAAMLVYVFGVIFRVLPTYGFSGPLTWILPSIAIGIVPGCLISRVARVALEEAMSKPYATTALAKGLSRRTILFRDALPNVIPVVITAFGIHFAYMVQAAIVIEPIFAWQGIAAYFLEAAKFRDFPVLQSTLLMFSIFFIVVNMIVDLIVLAVDPKQRRPRRL
jgi:peptide/nickel transport system permease protein